MWRKRATPAKAFKQPAAYNPLTGKHAPMGREGLHSRIAMFQVIEADTHDNYVVCRGWDLDTDAICRYGINSIAVAKPYSMRGTNPYKVGMVLTCGKPRTCLGDNSGKAETTVGHPADLDEDVVMLEDDDGVPIQWMILDSDLIKKTWAKVQTGNSNYTGATTQAFDVKTCDWDGANVVGEIFHVHTPIKANADTALFTGYIVSWHLEPDDTKLIDSDCWDDPIGTVKAVDVDAALRDGWQEISAARDRFLIGMGTSAGEDNGELMDVGGNTYANMKAGLQNHPENSCTGGGSCIGMGVGENWRIHSQLDGGYGTLNHRVTGDGTSDGAGSILPPFYTVKWIRRHQ